MKGLLQEAVGIDTDLHWGDSTEVLLNLVTVIRWNFPLEMNIKMVLFLLVCTRKAARDVLTASDCKLVHPDMTAILSSVLDFFTELGAVHYKKMQQLVICATCFCAGDLW